MVTHPLKKAHLEKRKDILARLADFKKAGKLPDEDIFLELVFCLLTPQSRARAADVAVGNLKEAGFPGKELSFPEMRLALTGVRFPNNKSKFVILARQVFLGSDGKISVRPLLPLSNPHLSRDWLVKNVKGLGMKEASHFLRNIGYGSELAILDVHVLRRLHKFGVMEKFTQTLSRKTYLEVEKRMALFSKKLGIPLGELDLILWSDGTGEIFK
jgi:N-glycosylase/DNA lyase